MFHRNSFKTVSFKETSWRFEQDGVQPPPVDVIPYGSGRMRYPEREKRERRDRDDDVLLFLLR